MKLYIPEEPISLVRLQIIQQGSKTEYLNFCETTLQEAIKNISSILNPHLLCFIEGKRTAIVFREAKGGKNGKSKSLSFYGLSPIKVKELIIKHFKK